MWNTILTTYDYLLLLVASFWLWSSTFGVLWMIWCVVAVVFATRSSSWCWILLVGGPCGAFAPRTPSHSAWQVGVLNISLGHSHRIASGGQEEPFPAGAPQAPPKRDFLLKKQEVKMMWNVEPTWTEGCVNLWWRKGENVKNSRQNHSLVDSYARSSSLYYTMYKCLK